MVKPDGIMGPFPGERQRVLIKEIKKQSRIPNFLKKLSALHKEQRRLAYNLYNFVVCVTSSDVKKVSAYHWKINKPLLVQGNYTNGFCFIIERESVCEQRYWKRYDIKITAQGKVILVRYSDNKPLCTWTTLKKFEKTILNKLLEEK